MKKLALIAATAATLAMAVPAIAQDAFIAAQGPNQHLAKDTLIGTKVYNDEGKIIGDIEDLILNDGNVVEGVIMGTGGFLGLAEKKIGVRLEALQDKDVNGQSVVALPGVTQETLEATPEYKRSKPKKSLLQRAREKTKELTDKTTQTSQDAYEKAKPTIEKAKEAAGQAYEKAKEAAGQAADAAKEAVEKAKDAASTEPAATPEPAPETTAPAASETTAPEATPETAPTQ